MGTHKKASPVLWQSKALSGKMKKTQRLEQMARQQAWPTAKVSDVANTLVVVP